MRVSDAADAVPAGEAQRGRAVPGAPEGARVDATGQPGPGGLGPAENRCREAAVLDALVHTLAGAVADAKSDAKSDAT